MDIKRNSGKELIALSEKSHISSHLERAPFSYLLFMPVVIKVSSDVNPWNRELVAYTAFFITSSFLDLFSFWQLMWDYG